MLKPQPLASAFAVVGLLLYVVCRVFSWLVPDLLYAVGSSWFHTFDLGTARSSAPMEIGTFLLGGITFGVLIWISTYSAAMLYNKWSK